MRKTILGHDDRPVTSSSSEWFGVEAIAGIAVTSEADDAPVENALYPPTATLAGGPESPAHRSFKITFSGPTKIRHIQLVFRESQFARTQEFTAAL